MKGDAQNVSLGSMRLSVLFTMKLLSGSMRNFYLIALGVLFAAGLLLISSEVYASEDVTTSVQMNYEVAESGDVRVTQQIGLKNLSASSYVSQYALELPSNRISAIKAVDGNQEEIDFSSSTSDTSTAILFNFSDPVVGKDKQTVITLTYINPDIATKVGNIVEINIPQLEKPEDYESYRTQVIVPASFGAPSLVSPTSGVSESDGSLTRILFEKDELRQGGLVIFGREQYYRIMADLVLSNPSITPIEIQFALPPDTPYQQVFLHTLSPTPAQMKQDKDGNFLVTYALEAKQELPISLVQEVIVYNTPTVDITVPDQDLNVYTKEDSYWERIDSSILGTNRSVDANGIYDYLVTNFKYDFSRLDNQSTHRLGALQAVKNPQQSLCLEFADTFISLARSQGTPARMLSGYAYTQNPNLKPLSLVQNTLHAWPEYYDVEIGRFRSVDPTWGQTTKGVDYFDAFDFNHIVFAINGTDSESPEPIGYSTQMTRKLAVEVIDQKPTDQRQYDLSPRAPLLTTLGLSRSIEVQITNKSKSSVYQRPLQVWSGTTQLGSTTVDSLLPYSQGEYQVELSELIDTSENLEIRFDTAAMEYSYAPISATTGAVIFAGTTFIASLLGIAAYKSRSVLVSKK